jgi:hypothetical protein
MDTTRRGFLASTAAATGAAVTQDLAHAADDGHDHQAVPSDPALRVKSLESLLVEKGLVDSAALDAMVDLYEHKIGPRNGARVVAKAWIDPAYRRRLLADPDRAIAELGYTGLQGEHMMVVENTPRVHNLVVCTLCSCYPIPTLGLPPVSYNRLPNGRARSSTRVAYCANSGSKYRMMSRCASGTAQRICGTSSCPNDRLAPTGSARMRWPHWSRVTR